MLFVLLFFGVVLLPAHPSPFLCCAAFPPRSLEAVKLFSLLLCAGAALSLPSWGGVVSLFFSIFPTTFHIVLFFSFSSRFVLVVTFPFSFRFIVSSFCCIVLHFTSCVAQRGKERRSGNTSDAFTQKVALTGPSTFAPWKQSFTSAVAGNMVGLTPRESAGVVMPRPSVETSRTEGEQLEMLI